MSQEPGNRIRGLRKKYGMTQKELSDLLDLSRETLSRIENGKMPPSFVSVHNCSNIFTLIEVGRTRYANNGGIQIPFFSRLSKEFGFSRETSDLILKIAIEGYTKKRENIIKKLEG